MVAACCLATQTATAQESRESKIYEFKGKVIAAREAEIAARVDGRLANINFTKGQIVKKGDLLFEFDVKFRQLTLDAAQAQQKVMEAQLQLTDVKLKNAEALQARNVSSEMQVLEAQTQRGIAAANEMPLDYAARVPLAKKLRSAKRGTRDREYFGRGLRHSARRRFSASSIESLGLNPSVRRCLQTDLFLGLELVGDFAAGRDPHIAFGKHVLQEVPQQVPAHRTARHLRMKHERGHAAPGMGCLELVNPERQDCVAPEDRARAGPTRHAEIPVVKGVVDGDFD